MVLGEIKPYKTLAEEIDYVRRYLENEEFRYGGRLSSTLYVDPEVDTSIVVPKRLIHIFVLNTLRHGLFYNGGAGQIDISIHKSSIGILIMVSDSGVCVPVVTGVVPQRSDEVNLLDSYLPLFNQQQDFSVSYNIVDLGHCMPGETGTRVLITLKT